MLPCYVNRMIASMWIGSVPRPPMIFAFMDGAGLLQYGYCPATERPDRRPSLFDYRHVYDSLQNESIQTHLVPIGYGFDFDRSTASHR